jgi:hypothetical protein
MARTTCGGGAVARKKMETGQCVHTDAAHGEPRHRRDVGEGYTSTAASQVPSAGVTHTHNDNTDSNNDNDNNATVAQQHVRTALPHASPERTKIHDQPSVIYNQHAASKTTTSRRRQRVGAEMQTRPAACSTRWIDRSPSIDISIHPSINQRPKIIPKKCPTQPNPPSRPLQSDDTPARTLPRHREAPLGRLRPRCNIERRSHSLRSCGRRERERLARALAAPCFLQTCAQENADDDDDDDE